MFVSLFALEENEWLERNIGKWTFDSLACVHYFSHSALVAFDFTFALNLSRIFVGKWPLQT